MLRLLAALYKGGGSCATQQDLSVQVVPINRGGVGTAEQQGYRCCSIKRPISFKKALSEASSSTVQGKPLATSTIHLTELTTNPEGTGP